MKYESRYACHPEDFKSYDTTRIRRDFLLDKIMTEDQISLCYIHYDRYIAGGTVPVTGAVELESIDPLKAEYFLERREMGIINVGSPGSILVDGAAFALDNKEALYIGRGARRVSFSSADPQNPARFYINSTPAHKSFPTRKIGANDAEVVEAGSLETANARSIRKLIVASVLDVCQLQMGLTELEPGSVWNTMPCHTHDRRMEVYFYFDVQDGESVCHFMGQPQETRHIWLQNEQAVISPPWSIHCGSGTGMYSFIWGMAGENLDYGDMDICSPPQLR